MHAFLTAMLPQQLANKIPANRLLAQIEFVHITTIYKRMFIMGMQSNLGKVLAHTACGGGVVGVVDSDEPEYHEQYVAEAHHYINMSLTAHHDVRDQLVQL